MGAKGLTLSSGSGEGSGSGWSFSGYSGKGKYSRELSKDSSSFGGTLAGTVSAAYQAGGISGVARATVGQPAARAAGAVTTPVRDAYREGAAAGIRATQPPPSDGSGLGSPPSPPTPPPPPAWATNLARQQQLRNAGMIATQAAREGDRPASGSGPDLKSKN